MYKDKQKILKESQYIVKIYFDTILESSQTLKNEINKQKIFNFPNLISSFKTMTNCYNKLMNSSQFNDIITKIYKEKDNIITKESNIISPTKKVWFVISIYQLTEAISELSLVINQNQQLIQQIMNYQNVENFIYDCNDQFDTLKDEIFELESKKDDAEADIAQINLQISKKEQESEKFNDILLRTNSLINLIESRIDPIIRNMSNMMTSFTDLIIKVTDSNIDEIIKDSIIVKENLYKNKKIEERKKQKGKINDSNS